MWSSLAIYGLVVLVIEIKNWQHNAKKEDKGF